MLSHKKIILKCSMSTLHANVRQTVANPEEKSVRLLIRIRDNNLYVAFDNTALVGTNIPAWTDCIRTPIQIDSPLSGYYLGLTAETGGLSDIHDVKSVQTYSFRAKANDTPEVIYKNREDRALGKDKDNKPGRRGDENPVVEFTNRLAELEKRDDTFESTLENSFRQMNEKIQLIENDQSQVLSRLNEGIESIRQTVDFKKLDGLKKDVQRALDFLDTVKSRLDNIELYVHGTEKKTAELHGLHDSGSEILEAVERSSNWGFWTYFLIIQFVIWVSFIWWKRNQDEKDRSHRIL